MFIKQALMIVALSLSVLAHSQECTPESVPATTPIAQFTDNHNGTVTDNKTGLMWKRCSEGQTWNSATNGCDDNAATYVWQAALMQAQTVNTTGGFARQIDWRLPNLNELESIVEGSCYRPAINLSIFPNTPFADFWSFWSSTPHYFFNMGAVGVRFDMGLAIVGHRYYDGFSVRLVRGGQ